MGNFQNKGYRSKEEVEQIKKEWRKVTSDLRPLVAKLSQEDLERWRKYLYEQARCTREKRN